MCAAVRAASSVADDGRTYHINRCADYRQLLDQKALPELVSVSVIHFACVIESEIVVGQRAVNTKLLFRLTLYTYTGFRITIRTALLSRENE